MADQERTLTSVKVTKQLFEQFRIASTKNKFTFQKLADRTVHLYLTDENFRKMIHSYTKLDLEK
jgi:hypothetical protein